MAYTPKEWKCGERITAEDMNHMEQGIANASQGGGGGSTSPMESVTYSELVAKRNAGQLVPGMQYRITDYICTTTQEESRAVSNQFDIIVVADSETILNENARACLHDGDTYYSSANANLKAWELKYTLDNDTNRFAWADATNGKGVVYWLKDEHNNECHYDFKQIQFKRYKITECENVPSLVGKYTSSYYGDAITAIDQDNPIWCYTFNGSDTSSPTDNAVASNDVFSNTMGIYNNGSGIVLNDIVFIGGDYSGNTFGDYCDHNTFGDYCESNTFGDYCESNTFGDYCDHNTFGNNCVSNTFGSDYSGNTFGNNCISNTFGDNCVGNTFGDYCDHNTFGDYCVSNTFGSNCRHNTFGNNCVDNTFGSNCRYNTFDDDGSADGVQYYSVLSGVSSETIPFTSGNSYATYVGINSNGVLKTWNPADLVQ